MTAVAQQAMGTDARLNAMAAGRLSTGLLYAVFARPLCRLLGITADRDRARKLGFAVLAFDVVMVSSTLAASAVSEEALQQAELANGLSDLAAGLALGLLAFRRRGFARFKAAALSAHLLTAGGGWLAIGGQSAIGGRPARS